MHLPTRGLLLFGLPCVGVALQLLGWWLAGDESEGLLPTIFIINRQSSKTSTTFFSN